MYIEEMLSILESRMVLILLREIYLGDGDAPINRQVWIIPCDCPFTLRSIIVIALILEDNFWGKYAEAMSKPARDKELTMIILA